MESKVYIVEKLYDPPDGLDVALKGEKWEKLMADRPFSKVRLIPTMRLATFLYRKRLVTSRDGADRATPKQEGSMECSELQANA
jgi:hypothetical protein